MKSARVHTGHTNRSRTPKKTATTRKLPGKHSAKVTQQLYAAQSYPSATTVAVSSPNPNLKHRPVAPPTYQVSRPQSAGTSGTRGRKSDRRLRPASAGPAKRRLNSGANKETRSSVFDRLSKSTPRRAQKRVGGDGHVLAQGQWTLSTNISAGRYSINKSKSQQQN